MPVDSHNTAFTRQGMWQLNRTSCVGATGLVGTRLVSKLSAQGHNVKVLTRNPNAAARKLPYPRVEVYGPERWSEAVRGSTAVINLAGAPLLLHAAPPNKSCLCTRNSFWDA